jgi:hypothetical protein
MKPKLKPPGTKRLKLNCDILLSTSAFKFNLRRYSWGMRQDPLTHKAMIEAFRGCAHPFINPIGRFQYIASVKCPYRVAGKASALGAGSDIPKPDY